MTPQATSSLAAGDVRRDTVSATPRTLPDWRSLVIDAYAAQPALSLTLEQGQRFWGMDEAMAAFVLDGLLEARLLIRTSDGRYCRADRAGVVDPVSL